MIHTFTASDFLTAPSDSWEADILRDLLACMPVGSTREQAAEEGAGVWISLHSGTWSGPFGSEAEALAFRDLP